MAIGGAARIKFITDVNRPKLTRISRTVVPKLNDQMFDLFAKASGDAWQSSEPIRVVRELILGGTKKRSNSKIMLGAELIPDGDGH